MMRNDTEMENSKGIYEFLRNLLLIRKGSALLLSGSAFELPIQYVLANATDVDIMYIRRDICALPVNLSAPRNFQGKTLIVNTEDTHPGFARLYSPDCKRLYNKQANIPENHTSNGPAWTMMMVYLERIEFINLICRNLGSSQYQEILKRLLDLKIDRVFAIHCPCWPTEVEEWITRERPSGWPTVEIVDKIVASGCYFVAKPHHSSPDDDTQWRFSFSQAEIILIHSWTDVQKYIYHILRLIKSEIVKACGGSDETIICTYFFKTLMFWDCERKPKEFWNDENVEKSVSELLCIMIGWLIDGCCPNYFIPKCDMISASTERVDFSKEIQLLLTYTKSNIPQVTTIWPKVYPKHTIEPIQVVIPERVLLHVNLMQVRDNYLNPLYPTAKIHLLKQLTEKNSLLWRQASNLYRGIVSHLQFMKTCCPIRKNVLKREALGHFQSSLTENGVECSKRFISIGDSIYEGLERFSRATDCKFKSSRTHKDIHKDMCDLHFSGTRRRSPLNTAVQCNSNTHGRFVRCYSRLVDGEEDDLESKITSNATIDHLNASIKTIVQNLFENGFDYVTITTRVISSAYLANFYYTALQDYSKASALCDIVKEFPLGTWAGNNLSFPDRAFPIFITNELSTIFDEHFRTVLGLITLHRSIVDSLHDNSAVLVRICPAQFLKYLRIQCKRWEGVDEPVTNEHFKCDHEFDERYDTYEPMSEVFMAAVLHASRCQH